MEAKLHNQSFWVYEHSRGIILLDKEAEKSLEFFSIVERKRILKCGNCLLPVRFSLRTYDSASIVSRATAGPVVMPLPRMPVTNGSRRRASPDTTPRPSASRTHRRQRSVISQLGRRRELPRSCRISASMPSVENFVVIAAAVLVRIANDETAVRILHHENMDATLQHTGGRRFLFQPPPARTHTKGRIAAQRQSRGERRRQTWLRLRHGSQHEQLAALESRRGEPFGKRVRRSAPLQTMA